MISSDQHSPVCRHSGFERNMHAKMPQNHCPKKSFAVWEIEGHNIIAIPSLSFCPRELKTVKNIISYEERILFVLLALANPNTELLIVTSNQVDDWTVNYYFSLLPKRLRDSARSRVRFWNLGDPSSDHCLAEKLCGNHFVIERIKEYCVEANMGSGDLQEFFLMIWRATEYEDKLGKLLGLPFYSATPEQSQLFGTKQGSRSIFKLLGIPCADGTYKEEKDLDCLYKSIWKVLRRNPRATKGVVKLADGFSGMGNAVLDLTRVQERVQTMHRYITDCPPDKELKRLTKLAFENGIFHRRTWHDYREEIPVMGCIFELFIDVEEEHGAPKPTRRKQGVTSPSVQGVIDEKGFVSILSTHEQVLDEQVYLGCEFPCKSDYRLQLLEYGKKVGDFLASAGVRDRFGVDFLCVPKAIGQWEIYAVEINLRMTGTTHPWMTLKLLTHGHVDPATGLFLAPNGQPLYYVSSDNISDTHMKEKLYPKDLFHAMTARPDLHWDPSRQKGVVLHMLGRVSTVGTLSMTAIAHSLEDAHKLFGDARSYLAETADSLQATKSKS